MSEENAADFDKPFLGLRWLVRLRWLAVLGQIVTCCIAVLVFHIELPLGILAGCLAITVATNAIVEFAEGNLPLSRRVSCAILLALDTVILTVMLYSTGGAHNPFTAFYLLHVVIAAILLPQAWSWVAVALCGICYGLLFLSPYTLASIGGKATCCGSFDFHLQGMLVAMLAVGGCVAFFVGQLSAALARREAELNEARVQTARNERFAGLATLAAGVAHELATPLSTIAVVSKELERQAEGRCLSPACLDDAKLIRTEVERCRGILEKLGDRATNGLGDPCELLAMEAIPALLKNYLKAENWGRVEFEIRSSHPGVFAPPAVLLQSLSVLVKNACEASAPGQTVRLKVRDDAEGIAFCIEDRGAGMTADILSRIGEPFFTTKEPGCGMGLGLFLVRTFVERMNGRLDIESAPGMGTLMNLFIPLPPEPTPP